MSKFDKLFVGFIICLLCVSPIAGANVDWNTLQGNLTHTGVAEGNSDFVTNLWSFNAESPVIGSPAIYGDNLYVVSQEGILRAINMENGTEDWSVSLKGDSNATPVISNNTVFVGNNESFKAIDIESQEILWKYNTSEEAIEGAAYVDNDTVYVGCDDGNVYGFNIAEGNKTFEADLGDDEIVSSPIVVNDTLYVASTNGNVYSINTNNTTINWQYATGDEIHSSPAYSDGKIIIGSNDDSVYALNESTGDVCWDYDLNNKVEGSAAIDEHNNNVYIGSDEGNLTCLDLRDGTFKWSYATGGPIQSTPAIKDDVVAFGSNDGNGYVLNKYTGEKEFSYNPGAVLFNSEITSSPVINENSLFIADHSGHVYSLNVDKNESPSSEYLFYSVLILIIILVVLFVVVKKVIKHRKR